MTYFGFFEPAAQTNIRSIQGCLETSHLLPNLPTLYPLTLSPMVNNRLVQQGEGCSCYLVPVKECRIFLISFREDFRSRYRIHSLRSSVLKMDREAIKGLGNLGFFMVCVREDGQPSMAARDPKRDPNEDGLWEGVRWSMGGGRWPHERDRI